MDHNQFLNNFGNYGFDANNSFPPQPLQVNTNYQLSGKNSFEKFPKNQHF